MNLNLFPPQEHTLVNALLVAAEKFEQNARELRAYADQPIGDHAIVTASGAHMLAEQFDVQAKDTRELLDQILDEDDDDAETD